MVRISDATNRQRIDRRVSDLLGRVAGWIRAGYLRTEEKPILVVLVAAGATLGVALSLASFAGWPHVLRVVYERHSWGWLLVCLLGEIVAYGGYVLTVRDIARVDGGPELDVPTSVATCRRGLRRLHGDPWLGRVCGRLLGATSGGLEPQGCDPAGAGIELPRVRRSVVRCIGGFGVARAWDRRACRGCYDASFADRAADHRRRVVADRPGSRSTTLPASRQLAEADVRRLGGGRSPPASLLTSPREHGLGVVGNIFYWAGDILCLWAAIQLVDGRITVAKLVLAYSGGYVLTRRALPAGGAGVVEIALTLALAGLGMHVSGR